MYMYNIEKCKKGTQQMHRIIPVCNIANSDKIVFNCL